jgi:thiol:disulfide interchange protein
MPFGVIYGALFFVVLAIWMVFSSTGPGGGALGAARLFIAPAALATALALLMRMRWARWAALLLAALVAWYELRVSLLAESVSSYLWLFGTIVALVLLAVPATGDPGRGRPEGERKASKSGRLLGLLVGCCLAGALGTMIWHGAEPGPMAMHDAPVPERVSWSDFGRGLEKANAEGKPLMVAFVTGWCGYCRQMDRVTWKDPDVLDELAGTIPVRVNAEESVERNGYRGVEIAARFNVGTYPTMLLLEPGGRELSRVVGYKSPREFLRWLRAR